MDRLQAMEVFVSVVNTGGFSRAADVLHMPKATVTTLIKNLETHLGVRLLNRTTRRVSVTPDGAAYHERCVRILADVEETEGVLSRAKSSPRGRLRVDVAGSFGRRVLVPELPQFFERYPDIRLQVGISDRAVDLIEEGVDCVVRGGEQPDSSLVARKLGTINFVTCASPEYLARYGTPESPRDLSRHRCVGYFAARTGRVVEWNFSRGSERVDFTPGGHLTLNDTDAMLAAGVAGLGIMHAAEVIVQNALRRGRLARVLADWSVDPLSIYVMYPHNRHMSAKVRVFVEWVAEVYERRIQEFGLSNAYEPLRGP
jgi:LysR family transcriptional regulator, regulator for bpeEF and oprC